jgi:hypothetical protein
VKGMLDGNRGELVLKLTNWIGKRGVLREVGEESIDISTECKT